MDCIKEVHMSVHLSQYKQLPYAFYKLYQTGFIIPIVFQLFKPNAGINGLFTVFP